LASLVSHVVSIDTLASTCQLISHLILRALPTLANALVNCQEVTRTGDAQVSRTAIDAARDGSAASFAVTFIQVVSLSTLFASRRSTLSILASVHKLAVNAFSVTHKVLLLALCAAAGRTVEAVLSKLVLCRASEALILEGVETDAALKACHTFVAFDTFLVDKL